MQIKVRIAPSPTGNLHVGTARTALYNWLFARHNKGEFLLRIEDTDLERSDKKFEEDILEGLKWLGLDWDGKVTRQSDRLNVYENLIQKLLNENKAFWCYHTKEELEKEKEGQMKRKEAPRHICEHKADQQTAKNDKQYAEEKGIIRLAVEEKNELIIFDDLVRGPVQFNQMTLGDISIAKDARTPLYNFAVVVDDHDMEISHVIRGEDHIANTPKQILIYQALGFDLPQFAHIPMILAPDRSKLSKRHGAESVVEFREQGFLPEAMVNYLSLVGWTPPLQATSGQAPRRNPDIFSIEELIKFFDLKDVHKGGAVFDIKKLRWMNGEYIKKLPAEKLLELLLPFTEKHFGKIEIEQMQKVLPFFKERAEVFDDIKQFHYFFKEPEYDLGLLVWPRYHRLSDELQGKKKGTELAKDALEEILKLDSINSRNLDELSREKFEGDRGAVYWPLRVALSGEKFSPDPLQILNVIGHEEAKKRAASAIKKLE